MHIGFVPTMGALHKGHISLIEQCKKKCDISICSIFVNPTQFNNQQDLSFYPKTIETDILQLAECNCDVLFYPEVSEMYAEGLVKDKTDDYGHFVMKLEGAFRPGHFDGVATIVKRFFTIIKPNEVFFGQKDYQQCMVVKTLISRNFPEINFNECAILRENDGLAMSSRNVRLNSEARLSALKIYRCLCLIKENWNEANWKTGLQEGLNLINADPNLKLEYLSVANKESLEELSEFDNDAVTLIAVNCGNVRLIDNMILE